jgi:N-acetylmuramate 1-kinase
MKDRSDSIDRFLAHAGWWDSTRVPLAGDASFRRYERVTGEGRRAVLMDAPPDNEKVRPFMQADATLLASGMSAPRILASDVKNGFLLLEDLGDDLYSYVLRHSPEKEEELYLAAADVLVELYRLAPRGDYSGFSMYNEALLMRECMLLAEWFLPEAIKDQDKAQFLGEEFQAIWKKLLTKIPATTPVLVLRDYHADNLLWLPERTGVQRVGLLDFQDAVIGSSAYDVVSFLEDARRDVSEHTVQCVLDYYLQKTKQERDAFMASYALLGAQRNCKIIGIFVRLAVRDKKPQYLSFLPRVWRHLQRDLQHPLLADLGAWCDANIPQGWRGV